MAYQRINITLPTETLQELDRHVKGDRSRFIHREWMSIEELEPGSCHSDSKIRVVNYHSQQLLLLLFRK